MSGSDLRPYVLGIVVAVLLGTGFGFGWHYLVDRSSGKTIASTITPATKQEMPNSPSSNPSARREGPVPDVPKLSSSSDARRMAIDLSNDEKLALADLLTRSIANDRSPSSPRVRTLQSVLMRLDLKPPAQPYPAPKAYAPTGAKGANARRRDNT